MMNSKKCGNCIHWNPCNAIRLTTTKYAYHCERDNNYTVADSECREFVTLLMPMHWKRTFEPEVATMLGSRFAKGQNK